MRMSMALGLPNTNDLRPRAPYWVPAEGGSWYAEFALQDRSWIGMASYSSLSALLASGYASFSRASSGLYLPTGGSYSSFSSGEPRQGDRGLLVEPATTNVLQYSECNSTDWTASGATVTDLSLGALGVAPGLRVASNGNGNDRARQITGGLSLTASTTYYVSAYYQVGTSGRVLVMLRDTADSKNTEVEGVIGGSITATATAAGSVANIVEELLEDGQTYRLSFEFTAAYTTTTYDLGIGPSSTTSGENIDALLGQVETAARATSYVATSGGDASRAADVFTVFPGADTYDITVTFDDDSTQLLSGEAITGAGWAIPADLDRRYIKNIAAVPA